ncbi:MAG: transposase [Thiobacillus sp.]|nr:transposase [Thiobacillus sp.]
MPEKHARSHEKDLRKGRVSLPGQVYHISTITLDRQPVFSDLCSARLLINTLREAQARGEATTLAFVVMPDHLHWLMQLEASASLPDVVGAVKAVSAHRLGKRIWQGGFHDHALRQEEDLAKVARYIVANPLRAGLVVRLADYPHWDAIWL